MRFGMGPTHPSLVQGAIGAECRAEAGDRDDRMVTVASAKARAHPTAPAASRPLARTTVAERAATKDAKAETGCRLMILLLCRREIASAKKILMNILFASAIF